MTLQVKLPDGSVRHYDSPKTVAEIAADISRGLAKKALGAMVNGEKKALNTLLDGDVALTIYYASEGEEIWDIAKRYNTAVSEIMENNALTEPTVASRRTLLIPIVK